MRVDNIMKFRSLSDLAGTYPCVYHKCTYVCAEMLMCTSDQNLRFKRAPLEQNICII